MSRPIPVGLRNHRFDQRTPSAESYSSALGGRSTPAESDQLDVISWDAAVYCPSESLELRKLDEASVDACFSRLSDLLDEVS